MKVYRVENQKEKHGIWRNFDGSYNPIFNKLSEGLAKSLSMDDSNFYRANGKQWFSATDTKEKLTKWFSLTDILEMKKMGYEVYEFEITLYREVSEYEIVFAREDIISQKVIDYREIWKLEKGA